MASRGDIKFEEVQPNLCKKWLKLDFEEALDKTGSFTKLKSKDYFDEGEFPVIDQGDSFISGYINDEELLYQGELPVVIFGDHTRVVKYIDFQFATGADGTKVLKPLDVFDSMFYFYYLKSLKIPSLGYSRHFKILKAVKIPLPPLAEQQRIVAKLDDLFGHLDSLKTRLNHIPQILKNFRQAVLTQAVTGKLTEEWRKGKELDAKYFKEIELLHSQKKKPVKVRGKKGFNEELKLYEIPKQWNWIPNFKLTVDGGNAICAGPFGTIFKAKDFRDEGVPIIFLRHVKKEGFNQNKPKCMEPSVWKVHHQEYSIYGGELLITKLGDPPGEATIFPKDFGTAMVTPDVMKANYNDDVFSTKYASFFFNSKVCKDLVAEISFGMTRLRIDLTMFKSFPIAVPPKEEQTEIVKRVEHLFAKVDAIEAQYQRLKTKIDSLPQAILAKAFKGDLVEQLDTDGDAKELLEEIQKLKEASLSRKPSLRGTKQSVKRKKK